MTKTPVIAIFDVGKTNKKLLLFNENYQVVYEKTARFLETVDEDGEPCENLDSLRLSVFDSLNEILKKEQFEVRAINFSTYGASLVYVDEKGLALTPLYNYLKVYPVALKKQFYATYGGKEELSLATGSPAMGNLNSGLQLYHLKHSQPKVFTKLKYALHLPQYLSSLLTNQFYAELTCIGCHTQLWDFKQSNYHQWLQEEGLLNKLAPIQASDAVIATKIKGKAYKVGVGLHDSSAALIPYLVNFKEPFLLLSTGTWCISLNPFNPLPLQPEELERDCLSYLSYEGKSIKASRLFTGHEHEQQAKRIAQYFNEDALSYRTLAFDPAIAEKLKLITQFKSVTAPAPSFSATSVFAERDLNVYSSAAEAYHQLIADLVNLQYHSSTLVIKGSPVKKIFVDGGFSKNVIFMNLLAAIFPAFEVYAAFMAQATALGTAMAIHRHWNSKAMANDMIQLKYYASHTNP